MIFHVSHLNEKPISRHLLARSTWESLDMIGIYPTEYPRTALDIGDPRRLPYLRSLLEAGMMQAMEESDIIMWCNDDVQLDPRIVDWCNTEVAARGALSMRRLEPGQPHIHMGRELFAFRYDWLLKNLHRIPDFIIGCPFFDLVIAAKIRKRVGFISTIYNMTEDMPGCDATERYAIHEAHESSWAGKNEHVFPANLHNKKLAKKWCMENMPSLQL